MEESVLFNTPLLLVLYGTAFILCIAGRKLKTGWLLPGASMLLCCGTSAIGILLGMSLRETATVLLLFIAVQAGAYRGDKKK